MKIGYDNKVTDNRDPRYMTAPATFRKITSQWKAILTAGCGSFWVSKQHNACFAVINKFLQVGLFVGGGLDFASKSIKLNSITDSDFPDPIRSMAWCSDCLFDFINRFFEGFGGGRWCRFSEGFAFPELHHCCAAGM